jgi:hypothetical protein
VIFLLLFASRQKVEKEKIKDANPNFMAVTWNLMIKVTR